MVDTRSPPIGAEQNDPAPWVGHTAVASGSSASRRSDRYCAGEFPGVVRPCQVGAGGAADDQRPAGEDSE
jgi:hypothetical protein